MLTATIALSLAHTVLLPLPSLPEALLIVDLAALTASTPAVGTLLSLEDSLSRPEALLVDLAALILRIGTLLSLKVSVLPQLLPLSAPLEVVLQLLLLPALLAVLTASTPTVGTLL